MSDDVLVKVDGPIHVLSLNRPDRINAFSTGMAAALAAALQAAADDDTCRAVLLRGEGRGFCSGQDLTEVPESADLGHLLEQRYVPIIRLLRTMAKPVVCAVHGVAAGAGANLALACDIVIAGHTATFVQAFVRIGLIPDVGGTWFLPRLVGSARARGLAMLGEAIEATQAEQWGLIWRAVPDEAVMAEAEAVATRLASLPTQAIALMKRALETAETNTLAEQLVVEQEAQRVAGYTPDFAEGVRAFVEKRPAVFTGLKGVTPEALARACAERMWRGDHASAGLGIALLDVGPGAARLSMTVERRMLNGHGTCHGGFIFALADSAFAFACNTDGAVSVASHCSITFLRPAAEGDTLVAVAEERQREGRQGIFDVRVSSGETIVAEFRGLSRTTGARIGVGDAA